jgi:RNA recognition motif-containing protein
MDQLSSPLSDATQSSSSPISLTTLYLGGLDASVDQNLVYSVVSPFGTIKSLSFPQSSFNKKLSPTTIHSGYAIVEFENSQDAMHAVLNLNESELNGRYLKCHFANASKVAHNTASASSQAIDNDSIKAE